MRCVANHTLQNRMRLIISFHNSILRLFRNYFTRHFSSSGMAGNSRRELEQAREIAGQCRAVHFSQDLVSGTQRTARAATRLVLVGAGKAAPDYTAGKPQLVDFITHWCACCVFGRASTATQLVDEFAGQVSSRSQSIASAESQQESIASIGTLHGHEFVQAHAKVVSLFQFSQRRQSNAHQWLPAVGGASSSPQLFECPT